MKTLKQAINEAKKFFKGGRSSYIAPKLVKDLTFRELSNRAQSGEAKKLRNLGATHIAIVQCAPTKYVLGRYRYVPCVVFYKNDEGYDFFVSDILESSKENLVVWGSDEIVREMVKKAKFSDYEERYHNEILKLKGMKEQDLYLAVVSQDLWREFRKKRYPNVFSFK